MKIIISEQQLKRILNEHEFNYHQGNLPDDLSDTKPH